MRRPLLCFCVFGLIVPTAQAAEVLKPFDQANRDPSLVKVRTALIKAAMAHDIAGVTRYMDPKIKLSFGGHSGRKEFARMVKKNPGLWRELVWVLEHGGKYGKIDGKPIFSAPYTFSYAGKIDPFEAGVVLGTGVRVRAAPSRNARIVGKLSYDVITVTDWRPGRKNKAARGWVTVKHNGRKAYVLKKLVRSVVDYRAGFVKKGGRWVMTFFLAGD